MFILSRPTHRHMGPGLFFSSILSIKCAFTTYMNPFDMLTEKFAHLELLNTHTVTHSGRNIASLIKLNRQSLNNFQKITMKTCMNLSGFS
jgi:hypothetical protein